MRPPQQFLRTLFTALFFLPAAFIFFCILKYGVNVVWWDQWRIVFLLEKYALKTISFADFFQFGYAHREVLPRLIQVSIALLTKYNTIVEATVAFVFLVAIILFFFYFLRPTFSGTGGILLAFPVSALIMNPIQLPIIFEFGISYPLTNALALACFFMIDRMARKFRSGRYLSGALACAFLATFSFASGMLLWPLGLFQLSLYRSMPWPEKRKTALIWIAVACGTLFLYFFDPHFLQYIAAQVRQVEASVPAKVFKVQNLLLLFSIYIGEVTSLSRGLMAIILLAISVLLVISQKRVEENAFFLMVLAFAVASLISIFFGRSGWDGGSGLIAPRYCNFTLLAAAAAYAMSCEVFLKGKRNAVVISAFVIVTALTLVGGWLVFSRASDLANYDRRMHLKAAEIILTYKTRSDDEIRKIVYPFPEDARRAAAFLESRHYNVFNK